MKPRWKTFVVSMAFLSIGAGSGMSARPEVSPQPAAAQSQEARTTAQLLQEVRELRAAIERMTVAGTRAQLLLGRLQMQEQRMTSLSRQLQETRTKLASIQRERQSQAQRIEQFTEGLDHTLTAEQRLDMESALKMTKQMVVQLDQQVSALQIEDLGVGQALSTEQARWLELNAKLEELEGLLATQKP
jgi:chromosome segregation ATPase